MKIPKNLRPQINAAQSDIADYYATLRSNTVTVQEQGVTLELRGDWRLIQLTHDDADIQAVLNQIKCLVDRAILEVEGLVKAVQPVYAQAVSEAKPTSVQESGAITTAILVKKTIRTQHLGHRIEMRGEGVIVALTHSRTQPLSSLVRRLWNQAHAQLTALSTQVGEQYQTMAIELAKESESNS